MIVLLLPVAVPIVLVAAWLLVLRRRGTPGLPFFAAGLGPVLLSVVAGAVAGAAEDRGLPDGCGTAALRGLECGFGVGRLAGLLGAVTGLGCLALLAVVSAILRLVREHRDRAAYRGLPALTAERDQSARIDQPWAGTVSGERVSTSESASIRRRPPSSSGNV